MNAYATTQAYRESAVLTATPGQLVVMLYDGAIRFLRQADAALAEGDPAHVGDRLSRAEAIITELQVTLDVDQGEIAANLDGLYAFWRRCLGEVRLHRDREKLARVIAMVAELRGAWAQIAQSA